MGPELLILGAVLLFVALRKKPASAASGGGTSSSPPEAAPPVESAPDPGAWVKPVVSIAGTAVGIVGSIVGVAGGGTTAAGTTVTTGGTVAGVTATGGTATGTGGATATGGTATGASAGPLTVGGIGIGSLALYFGLAIALLLSNIALSEFLKMFARHKRSVEALGQLGSVREMLDFEHFLIVTFLDKRGVPYTVNSVADASLDTLWHDSESGAGLVSHGYRITYLPSFGSQLSLEQWEEIQALVRLAAFHWAHAAQSYARGVLTGPYSKAPYALAIDRAPDTFWFQQLPGGTVPGFTQAQSAQLYTGADLSALFNLATALAVARVAKVTVETDTRAFIVFPAPEYAQDLYRWFSLGGSGVSVNGDLLVFSEQTFGPSFGGQRMGLSIGNLHTGIAPWVVIPT